MSLLFPNYSRPMTKGNYATDFSNLKDGCEFPDNETKARNSIYKHNMNLFTGEYANNKKLVAIINDEYREINYKVLPLNYFKLIIKLGRIAWQLAYTVSSYRQTLFHLAVIFYSCKFFANQSFRLVYRHILRYCIFLYILCRNMIKFTF